jgi:hypothetical protein
MLSHKPSLPHRGEDGNVGIHNNNKIKARNVSKRITCPSMWSLFGFEEVGKAEIFEQTAGTVRTHVPPSSLFLPPFPTQQ